MILGPLNHIYTLAIMPGESPENFEEKLTERVANLEGQEILALVDLLGGTPYNIMSRQACTGKLECVTGVNLPMLLELLSSEWYINGSAAAAAAYITEAGKDSIKNIAPLLKPDQDPEIPEEV